MPLPEEIPVVPGDTEIHRVEPEDIANHLTAFHWELFRCIHEVPKKQNQKHPKTHGEEGF